MKSKLLMIAALAAALCGVLPLQAADDSVAVVGEKLDSGLGLLPALLAPGRQVRPRGEQVHRRAR